MPACGGGSSGGASSSSGGGGSTGTIASSSGGVNGPAGSTYGALNKEQYANAVTIVRVGQQGGVPERGWVVALAAAMQVRLPPQSVALNAAAQTNAVLPSAGIQSS